MTIFQIQGHTSLNISNIANTVLYVITKGSTLLMYLYPHLCVGSATKKHAVNWLKLAVLTLIDDRSQITENTKIYHVLCC